MAPAVTAQSDEPTLLCEEWRQQETAESAGAVDSYGVQRVVNLDGTYIFSFLYCRCPHTVQLEVVGKVPEEINEYFATRYWAPKKSNDFFATRYWALKKVTIISLLITFPTKTVTIKLKNKNEIVDSPPLKRLCHQFRIG
jgi:hypothetical protein